MKDSNSNSSTLSRKQDHIDLCLNSSVESEVTAGWNQIQLPHRALPDLNFANIETTVELWGHRLSSPFLISSMTGGNPDGDLINFRLAKLAEKYGLAMGVGSQRVLLENRESSSFQIRKEAPNAVLFANIGAVQLNYGVGVDDCKWLIDKLEAQALILHANVLQEAIQAEGDRNFSGLVSKIAELKKAISVPLILKETGCGLDPLSCKQAIEAGVDALDSAGLGGTHWGLIEGLRSETRKPLGETFKNWGIPSVDALENCVNAANKTTKVFASGGIRSGLDAAKAVFVGADLAGMALPFFKAAQLGEEALENFYTTHLEAFKIAMLCTGSKNPASLRKLKING